MRVNLPASTPSNIVTRIRAVAHAEHFPCTVSISTRNPSGIVNVRGKGSDSVEAQSFFAWAVKELRESGALN